MKILMIDNYDSFTYNLVHYLEASPMGVEVVVKTPDELHDSLMEEAHGIIISPGPSHPADRQDVIGFVRRWWDHVPVLGICLGHQMLWHMAGGVVECGERPVHGHVFPIKHDGMGLFSGLPRHFHVTRYHSLECTGPVPEGFIVSSRTEDGVVMGIRHERLPIFGLQYHPEAILSENGMRQLERFITVMEGGFDVRPYEV